MMRKVSQQEIEKLYQFTRQHYVEYFDLQTELVDHLATGMEENWSENPEMNFEENLQKEFEKFGVYGFMHVIESHQKAMNKKYWKILWRETKSELANPKILFFSLLLFLLPFGLSFSKLGIDILQITLFLLTVFAVVYTFRQNKKQAHKKKTNQKVYLLEAMISNAQSSTLLFMLSYQVVLFIGSRESFEPNMLYSFLIALAVSLPFLIIYLTIKVLPQKKEEILKEVHPERILLT
ncbi:MAG TPA: hypothetical protein VK021_04230 [Flavobacteriaceae bacterium]|nr:hypothetical protein [Flavobacteriaceae bacterium]